MIYATPELPPKERDLIAKVDEVRNRLKHILSSRRRWTGQLRRSTFARAIRGSNSIEGFEVSAEDALAAVDGEEPLDADRETWGAIRGYRDAMTYVLQLAADPHFSYSEALLRSLHFMMLSYDLTKRPGSWRLGPIYVRDDHKREIVYEGPDAELVPSLMRELVESLNAAEDSPAMVRAAMGHLNLVLIHPFSDGNGRMARALQSLILAREGILDPRFCSIEEYLGANTQAYYDVLAKVGKGRWNPQNPVLPWIRFSLTAHWRQAETLLRRTRETERVWSELEEIVNARSLPERVVYALSDATFGYRVRNAIYRVVAEVSDTVASRDLKLLVDEGLLVADGEKRGRAYRAGPLLVQLRQRTREAKPKYDTAGG